MKKHATTTKEMVCNGLAREKGFPLFNPEAIATIRREMAAWKDKKVRQEDRENWCFIPRTVLSSDTPRELIYTPLSVGEMDYSRDIGFPGQEPYVRGIHSNMYRGRKFTMRQLTGFGGPEDTNQRMKFMLEHGATGLNLLFDIPTVQMCDSDDPFAEGQVGMSGVCVDTVDDWHILFEGIPLDEISLSIVTHFPSNTAILFPMYLVLAEERGISWDMLRGSVQNDVTMEEVVRSGPVYIPPDHCFRIQCDNVEFIREQVPQWNFMTLNGYNLREFGTSAITETAVAMANAIETLSELVRRGHKVDTVAERLAFFWSPANDFFEEIARLRAARRLWFNIMKYRFDAQHEKSMWMRCHVQTSGVCLVQQEPLNNIVRAGYHALAAILGGAQSLHVDSYDEAYSVPTEEAALVSLRTQQIIQEETQVTAVVDPLGGSYYVEALTNDVEKKILDEIDEIEKAGGYVDMIRSGDLHRKIARNFSREQRDIEEGTLKIVGLNYAASAYPPPPIKVFHYPEEVETRQRARLARLKSRRDNVRVAGTLEALQSACRRDVNIVPYTLECARARCTEGEMFIAMKEAFGEWRPPSSW